MDVDAKKAFRPSKGLLQSEELYEYVLHRSVYPREAELLKELRQVTAAHPRARMATAPDAGQMIAMLLNLIGAKRTIEIGVFTGYSLLLTALSIPDDGKIIAVDMNRQSYEMGLPVIKKAGVEHKIDFMESEALPVLDKLLESVNILINSEMLILQLSQGFFTSKMGMDSCVLSCLLLLQEANEGSFDFAYVDADKVNYWNYHERLMRLLRPGGVVCYDNTLWSGTVVMPKELVPEWLEVGKQFTIEFNEKISADSRVQICQAPLGDGITICRRIK